MRKKVMLNPAKLTYFTVTLIVLFFMAAILPSLALADELGSDQAPASYQPVKPYSNTVKTRSFMALSVAATENTGPSFIIIEDSLPWGLDSNERAIQELGFNYRVVGTDSLANLDLSNKNQVIVIPSDQTNSSYSNLINNKEILSRFVEEGGILVTHGTDLGWNGGDWSSSFLPGGVFHDHDYNDNLSVNATSHQIVQGLDNSDISNWGYSTHGHLTNLPSGAAELIAESGQPTYIEYQYGKGRVLATMQTLEFGYAMRGQPGLLLNELAYAASLVPAMQTRVELITPQSGDTVGKQVEITAAGENITTLTVAILNEKGSAVYQNTAAASQYTWTWDSTTVEDGEYIIRVTGRNQTGREASAEARVMVSNQPAQLGIEPYQAQRLVEPGGGLQGAVSFNGNLTLGALDIDLPAQGPSMTIGRQYNSMAKNTGSFGRGWQFSLPSLQKGVNGTVKYTDPDGTTHTFTSQGNGLFTAPPGLRLMLSQENNGFYALKDHTGTLAWRFSQTGKPVSLTDQNGNSLTYTYSPTGQLTGINDPSGRATILGYNAAGKISQITDYAGRTVYYSYDGAGLLLAVTNQAGETVRFSYNATGLLETVTDAKGNRSQINYDETGRVASFTNASGNTFNYRYDPVQSQLKETDPKGNSVVINYTLGGKQAVYTDPEGHSTSYTYDDKEQLTSVTDPSGYKTIFTYDDPGNLQQKIDPTGGATVYSYNSRNLVTQVTDPAGNQTGYGYDVLGNLIAVTHSSYTTQYIYDERGNLIKETAPGGFTTTYQYDNNGGLIASTDPLGYTTRYEYDLAGNPVKITGPTGVQKIFRYDGADRVIEQNNIAPDGQVADQQNFTYDAIGKLASATNSNGGTTTYSYNPTGQPLQETSPLGHVTRYNYDSTGRLTSVTGPDGAQTTYAYETRGNLASITDPRGYTTSFTHDPIGNVTNVTDPEGRVTRLTYDSKGNATEITDSQGSTTTYRYDPNDNLIASTDSLGYTTAYGYDALGNLRSQKDPSGNKILFDYDGRDNLIATTDSLGNTVGYNYDPRVISAA